MGRSEDPYRMHATVSYVKVGPEDHGIPTVWIGCEFGGSQGFGGMCLDENTTAAYVDDICTLFSVSNIDDIVGRHCFVLKSFSGWSERVEGLEVEGRRFTISGFMKRHWPDKYRSRLEQAKEQAASEIAHLTRRIRAVTEELARMDEDFRDWEV
jgi:hypothetical protein